MCGILQPGDFMESQDPISECNPVSEEICEDHQSNEYLFNEGQGHKISGEYLFDLESRPRSLESAVREIMTSPNSDVFLYQDVALLSYKYNELNVIREFLTYLSNTYRGHHYVGKNGIQVNDLLIANGIAPNFWSGNIIKYVARFGNKNGVSRKDLIKALHYLILLLGHESTQGEY